MNEAKMAKRVAARILAAETRELRIMTWDDVMNDTSVTSLKAVAKGTLEEINQWAAQKGLEWKESRKNIFGGYWYDKRNGEAYVIT